MHQGIVRIPRFFQEVRQEERRDRGPLAGQARSPGQVRGKVRPSLYLRPRSRSQDRGSLRRVEGKEHVRAQVHGDRADYVRGGPARQDRYGVPEGKGRGACGSGAGIVGIGRSGRISSQHTAAIRYSPDSTCSGRLQLPVRSTITASTSGLKNAPTWPDVFITELSSAVLRPPRPMAVDQLGASVNIENAPPTAISVPPMRGFAASVPASIAAAAKTYDTEPIARIPLRTPKRRH